MSQVFDFLFAQYATYDPIDIGLEIIGVVFGLLSVWLAKKNHIGVFPTGMISTFVYVYLLFQWGLIGDMMINAYYFAVSIYGWYIWTRVNDQKEQTHISSMSTTEWRNIAALFLGSLLFVYSVYQWFGLWNSSTAVIDTFTTAIFFSGMWLMARRKIENWIFWIVGDVISVPLYLVKGFSFTSFQYLIFTFIAIFGYLAWKKTLDSHQLTVLK
ncbi:MAG: nicotinamide mononucleotide transporter [Flavobacteriaceae bacterium]|jgi:nicotinamide mononucleotide transporter|nr:nicotinamide mononucleotide transporter [Flavobacteriaceae bacterium]MDG0967968.1 nicotinamide riboside transporter PnuC [Flavobacteriaceae bacterium]